MTKQWRVLSVSSYGTTMWTTFKSREEAIKHAELCGSKAACDVFETTQLPSGTYSSVLIWSQGKVNV